MRNAVDDYYGRERKWHYYDYGSRTVKTSVFTSRESHCYDGKNQLAARIRPTYIRSYMSMTTAEIS